MIVIENQKLRNVLRYLIPLVLIPVTVWIGATAFDEKRHLFVSLFVAILTLCLFISGIERKIVGTRRMVIVAVMIALSIAGRFIPFFKPITAITMITAMYLGAESGFTVGAFSALISNFYFGQGPWTPFQMLAFGLIGFISGLLSKHLRKSRAFLLFFGALSGILYSLIMDIWTILWYSQSFEPKVYLGAFITALPHTILYAVSNVVFLWLIAKPFGDKLARVKIKYGV